MVTETKLLHIKSTVRSEMDSKPISLLNAEPVDDLRKGIEEPASVPAAYLTVGYQPFEQLGALLDAWLDNRVERHVAQA